MSGDTLATLRFLQWDMLGFGACRAAYLCCFNALSSLTSASFALPLYWLVAVIAGFAIAFFSWSQIRHDRQPNHGLLIIGSASISLLGLALVAVAGRTFEPFGLVLGYAGSVLAGIGCAGIHVLWGLKLSRLRSGSIVIYVALGFTLAAAVLLSVNLLGVNPASAALMLTIVGLFALNDGWSTAEVDNFSEKRERPIDIAELAGQRASDSLSRPMSVKLCVMMLVIPFSYHFAVMTFIETSVLNRDLEGLVVALLAIVIVAAARRIRLLAIFRCTLPIVVAAYLLTQILPATALDACAVIAGSGLKLAELFVWALLVSAAQDNKESRWVLISLGTAAMFAGRAIAFAFSELLTSCSWYNPAIAAYLIVVLLVAAVIVMLPESRLAGEPPVEHVALAAAIPQASQSPAADPTLDERCDFVAARAGLTPRESEIFKLLAAGRSQSIIAERLGITEGTAHVHIVHVYRKLGVHGQQELISMAESATTKQNT